jgi:DNA-binding Lrp family transcriptional regulator
VSKSSARRNERKSSGNNPQDDKIASVGNSSNHLKALSLLDETNKKIISLVERNVAISQSEIAKELGLSQSSIALRLEKLRKSELLIEETGIEVRKLGLQMCRADLSCSDIPRVLNWARSCPLLVNGTVSVGHHNVTLYFMAEDIEMFQEIIDEHLRKLPGVGEVIFSPIVSWVKNSGVAVPLDVKKTKTPPCAMLPFCHRCPTNPDYNGSIWDGARPLIEYPAIINTGNKQS